MSNGFHRGEASWSAVLRENPIPQAWANPAGLVWSQPHPPKSVLTDACLLFQTTGEAWRPGAHRGPYLASATTPGMPPPLTANRR